MGAGHSTQALSLLTVFCRPIKFGCEILGNDVVVTLIMATLEPSRSNSTMEETQTQALSNGTGQTMRGRELRNELDEEEEEDEMSSVTRSVSVREIVGQGDGTDEERTPSSYRRSPVTTPLSTSSTRSRASGGSASKRKFGSQSPSPSVNRLPPNALLTPKRGGRHAPSVSVSPVSGGTSSPSVPYLGGMSRLRKIIMDEEEET
jgi:hypothetical protein